MDQWEKDRQKQISAEHLLESKQIKVQITEDRIGNILITPVNKKYKDFDFYIQVDYQCQDFLIEFSKARYGRKNEYGNYEVYDGNIFMIETGIFWDYYNTYG